MLERVVTALPSNVRQRLRRLRRPAWFGSLGGVTPISESWGFDRGTPVDRYYIEQFLTERRGDIRGRVLEILDSSYTRRFGTDVARADVLDINAANPKATIVADLTAATDVPGDQFDCFVLTQTLHLIYDTRAAVAHAHRLLRPGGVVLATLPVVSRIVPRYGLEADQWRFTAASARRMFADEFGDAQVEVRTYGNVLASVAFLKGVAVEELSRRRLEVHDPFFPMLVAVRAVKRGG